MKKFIIFAAAAAAVLTGCTKEMSTVDNSEDVQTITMNAGFANTDTKLAYEADGTGYKATWTNVDIIRLFYNRPASTTLKRVYGSCFTDKGDVIPDEIDKTKATIKFDIHGGLDTLKGNTQWAAYATSGDKADVKEGSYNFWSDNYGKQDGTLEAAQKLIFFYATGSNLMTDIQNPVSFVCANTLLKFTLTFPEDVTGTASDITISGNGIYSTGNYSFGVLSSENSTAGSITISKEQAITNNKISFYVACAPATVKNVAVTAKVGEVVYAAVVDATSEGKVLAAGKVYNVARTMVVPITKWVNDEAGSITVEGETKTYEANTSGAPKTTVISLASGKVLFLTQVEAKDFKGSWMLNAQFFSNNTKVISANKDGKASLTAGAPITNTELTDCNGNKHTANIGFTGLYDTAVLDASFEFDYENAVANMYVLLDARSAQSTTKSNVSGYNYVCFIPEMGTSTGNNTWAKPWNFVQADIDETNDLMWLKYTSLNSFGPLNPCSSFGWNSFNEGQFMNGSKKTAANRVIGITCAVCKNTTASSGNVYATYNVIYQANVNQSASTYMTFTKK